MGTIGALSRVPLSGLPYTLSEGLAARLRSPRDGASGRRRASASPGLVVGAAVPAPGPAGDWAAPGPPARSRSSWRPLPVGGLPCRAQRGTEKARIARAILSLPGRLSKDRRPGGPGARGKGRAHMTGRSYRRPRPSPVSAHAPYSGRSGWRSGRRSFAACLLERLTHRGTDAHEPHGSAGQKIGGTPVLLDKAGSCRRAGSVRVSHASVA